MVLFFRLHVLRHAPADGPRLAARRAQCPDPRLGRLPAAFLQGSPWY